MVTTVGTKSIFQRMFLMADLSDSVYIKLGVPQEMHTSVASPLWICLRTRYQEVVVGREDR